MLGLLPKFALSVVDQKNNVDAWFINASHLT